VPVEDLRVGDRVRCLMHGASRIVWIGWRRIDLRQHADPSKARPVRVRTGAFADRVPRRDLFLSPDHAVFVDDVLIPIKFLINGTTIEQVPVNTVTYYHVELAGHDVLLAEDLPAESYLDTGDRSSFSNDGGPMALHPDFSSRLWEANGCAPLVVTGQEILAVRERLEERARYIRDKALNESSTTRGSQTTGNNRDAPPYRISLAS
jgi:hypothetical protein